MINEVKRGGGMSSIGVGFRSLYPGLAEFFDRFPEMKGKQGTWWEKGDRTYNPTYANVVGRWEKNWNWPTKGILVIDDKDLTDEMIDFIENGMGPSTARMPYRFSDESKPVRYSWKMMVNKDKRSVVATTEGTLNSTNEQVSSKKYAMFWPTQNVNEIKRQTDPRVSDIGAGISTTGYACEVVENSDVKTGPPFSTYVEGHDKGILDHISNLLQCSKNRLVTVMWDVERPEYEELLKSVEMKTDDTFVPKYDSVKVFPIDYSFEIGAAVYRYRYNGDDHEYHILRLPAERVNEIKRGVDPLKTMNVGISAIHPAWDDMIKHFGDRPIPDSRGSILKNSPLTKLDDIILRERIAPVMKSDKLVLISYAMVPSEVKSKYSGRLRSAKVDAFTEIIDDEVYDCEVRQLPIPGIARVNISTLRMVRGREMPTKYEFYVFRAPYAGIVNEVRKGSKPLDSIGVGKHRLYTAYRAQSMRGKDPREYSLNPNSIGPEGLVNKIIEKIVTPTIGDKNVLIISWSEITNAYRSLIETESVDKWLDVNLNVGKETYVIRYLPAPEIGAVAVNARKLEFGKTKFTWEWHFMMCPSNDVAEVNELRRESSALSAISAGAANVNAYMHNLMKKYKRLPIIKVEELPGLLRNRMYVVSRILGVDENDIVPISLSQKTKGSSADLVRSIKLKSNGSSDDDQTRLFIEGPRRETRGVITLFNLHGAVSAEVTIYGKRDFWFLLVPYTGKEINEIKKDLLPLKSIDAGKNRMLMYNVLMNHDPKSIVPATDMELDNEIMWKVRDEIVAPSLGCSPEQVAIVTWKGMNVKEFDDVLKELEEESGTVERIETEYGDADIKNWGDHHRGVWVTDVLHVGNSSADDTYYWVRIPSVNEIKRSGPSLDSIGAGVVMTSSAYDKLVKFEPEILDEISVTSKHSSLHPSVVERRLKCDSSRIAYVYYDILSEETRKIAEEMLSGEINKLEMATLDAHPTLGNTEHEVWVKASAKEGIAKIKIINRNNNKDYVESTMIALRKPIQ